MLFFEKASKVKVRKKRKKKSFDKIKVSAEFVGNTRERSPRIQTQLLLEPASDGIWITVCVRDHSSLSFMMNAVQQLKGEPNAKTNLFLFESIGIKD